MIGTLVVALPSRHEGGDVHLSHNGKRRVFAPSKSSAFDLVALAWYSDVTYETKPLLSGYRLVITYNLLQNNVLQPSAGLFDRQQAQLQALLRVWAVRFPSKRQLIYPLSHQYSNTTLSS